MPRKRSGGGLTSTQQAAKFLGVSVLAGALLAGIALPAVGALGLSAKGTVKGFDEIPANLKTPPLSQKSTILDSKGGLIAEDYSRNRTVIPLKDMGTYIPKALVAIEDSRFYEHGAIDLKGVLRALNRNAQSGGVSQGASTLTQQYVKNVFVEQAGDDQSKFNEATQQTLGRKVQELKYAIQVEEELGKKKILENLLNITFFGEKAYGIEAAAQRYFSKPAKDLSLGEAALLAGIVQSPSRYDPLADLGEATKRRNTVLQRMADVGDITQAEAEKAGAAPIKLKPSVPKVGCITAVKGAGFFCDYVRNVILQDPAFGKTKEERAKLYDQGGLTIRTTLDPTSQKSAQESIKDHVRQSDKVASAVTLVQPGTGKILAMAQSKPYGFGTNQTQINYSVNKSMGGSNFGFPTGSTFKPFLAAAALEQGTPPTKVYPAPYEMPYPDSVQTCGKPWTNKNGEELSNESESEHGPYDLKKAMALSINTYFVQMVGDIGLCPVRQITDKLHVVTGDGSRLPQEPAVVLGAVGLSPLTMASAYATFANRGTYCSPIAIESVTGPDGKELSVPKSACSKAMSEGTADAINTLLSGVIDSGTGHEAGLTNRDNAGKTGTTDERRNAWFVGYTPNLAGAVWVGSATQKVKMTNITIGGVYHEEVFGADTPGPIWRDAMTGALAGKQAPQFNTIDIPDMPKKKKPDDRDQPGDGQDQGQGQPDQPGGKPGDNPGPGRHHGGPGGNDGDNGDDGDQ